MVVEKSIRQRSGVDWRPRNIFVGPLHVKRGKTVGDLFEVPHFHRKFLEAVVLRVHYNGIKPVSGKGRADGRTCHYLSHLHPKVHQVCLLP